MTEQAILNDALFHFPEFDIGYSFDEMQRPSEVTIFEPGDEISTRWITVGKGVAVPLEETL